MLFFFFFTATALPLPLPLPLADEIALARVLALMLVDEGTLMAAAITAVDAAREAAVEEERPSEWE